jgi:chorismate mutase
LSIEFNEKLFYELRRDVDAIDLMILELIAERMKIVRRISRQKRKLNVPVLDREREKQVKKLWRATAKELGLENKFISKVLKEVIEKSKDVQREEVR